MLLRKNCSACWRPFGIKFCMSYLLEFSKAYYIQISNVNSFSISNEENCPRNKKSKEIKMMAWLASKSKHTHAGPCMNSRPTARLWPPAVCSVRTDGQETDVKILKLLAWGDRCLYFEKRIDGNRGIGWSNGRFSSCAPGMISHQASHLHGVDLNSIQLHDHTQSVFMGCTLLHSRISD